jgi:hypothetical protein
VAGCVLTEVCFERALLGTGRDQELLLARLHRRVDLYVELPAFILVPVTGVALLSRTGSSGWLYAKVAFGLLAVAANAWCVWRVDDLAEFLKLPSASAAVANIAAATAIAGFRSAIPDAPLVSSSVSPNIADPAGNLYRFRRDDGALLRYPTA